MNYITVIISSKYGITLWYAAWFTNKLNAALCKASNIKPEQLANHDVFFMAEIHLETESLA